jgi:arylformamidase
VKPLEIIDLTLPARHGDGRFGEENDFRVPYTYQEHGWQAASFSMFAHFGSHVDAPLHFIEGGGTIDEVPLSSLIGPGRLFDLHEIGENEAIDRACLESRQVSLESGDIAVLRTDWTDKHWGSPTFLRNAPYLTEDAAQWLVDQGVSAVVYDFPEERAIREAEFGGTECVVHHVILGSGVYNIEYVVDLAKLPADRSFTIIALPLKLVGLDGAPARVIAVVD